LLKTQGFETKNAHIGDSQVIGCPPSPSCKGGGQQAGGKKYPAAFFSTTKQSA
jgi:hypothetical protein